MARTFSNSTITRALDVAMFMVPAGLPATAFKQELEDRLIHECQFNSGMIGEHRSGIVPIRIWEQSRFGVKMGVRSKI